MAGEAGDRVPLVIAHNGWKFDLRVLHSHVLRYGLEWPEDWAYLDTLVYCRESSAVSRLLESAQLPNLKQVGTPLHIVLPRKLCCVPPA